MAIAKTMSGARGRLIVNGKLQGVFSNVSYGVTYDMQPIYTLGRFNPQEIVPAGQEAIALAATGFRVIDNGPHVAASLPKLQDLLNHEDIEITLEDRQTGKKILSVLGVRPTGYNTTLSARGVQEITVNFIGLVQSDESGDQEDTNNAVKITDPS